MSDEDPLPPSLQPSNSVGQAQNNTAGETESERNTDFMNPFMDPINPGKSTFDKVMPAVTGGLAAIVSATPLGPAGGLAVAALGTGVQTLVDSQEATTPLPSPPATPTYTESTGEAAALESATNAPIASAPVLDNE
jgi:hypothetical protein